MDSLFWSRWARLPLFTLLVLVGSVLSAQLLLGKWSDFSLLWKGFSDIYNGAYDVLSQREFAYALASMLVSVALGLALAYYVMHVFALRFTLSRLRKLVESGRDPRNFRDDFDRIREQVSKHPIIGHAFAQFAATCFKPDAKVAHNTIRPQVFVNLGVAREHLFGLKMMPALPGFFVGLGLLFTFIGLVIALAKAAGGFSGPTDTMVVAAGELVNAATFKFSTSIAGLFASLFLSLTFKAYSIAMESSFDAFCRSLETRLRYLPPQSVSVEILKSMDEQVECLKQITDDQFFARFGEAVSPAITAAVSSAVEPIAGTLDRTVDRITQTSQQGVGDLLQQFIDNLQNGAGREMHGVASGLGEIRGTLEHLKSGLSASGTQFTREMTDATEKLAAVIEGANRHTSETNTVTQETLKQLLDSLAVTIREVKSGVTAGVDSARNAASDQVQAAMAAILDGTRIRMSAFQTALTEMQKSLNADTMKAIEASTSATVEASAAASRAVAEITLSLRGTLDEAVASIRTEVVTMSDALKASGLALDQQAEAMRGVALKSTDAADAFSNVARMVSESSTPLVRSGEVVAGAAKRMSESIELSAVSLSEGNDGARALALELKGHIEQIKAIWEAYEQRFDRVDQALAGSVDALAEGTQRHQEKVIEFVRKIDQGCAKAVGDMSKLVHNLSESTDELSDTLGEFVKTIKIPA